MTLHSFAQLQELIDTEYQGIKEREDYAQIMQRTAEYYEFLDRIGGAERIRRRDVVAISKEMGIPIKRAEWIAFEGTKIEVVRILEFATSQSEFREIIDDFTQQLDGLTSWDDVKRRLEEKYPEGDYLNPRYFEARRQNVIDFFRLMNEVKGGTTRGISTRMNIPEKLVINFIEGVPPYLIRLALASDKSELMARENISKLPLNMWRPTLYGREVTSVEQLHEMISEISPRVFDTARGTQLLHQAELHLKLYQRFQPQGFIRRGEIASLSRTEHISPTTLRRWLREGVRPRLYDRHDLVPVSLRDERLEKLRALLNGVTSPSALLQLSLIHI